MMSSGITFRNAATGPVEHEPESQAAGERSRRLGTLYWRAVAPVVLGTLLIAALALAYGRWIVDDAGITFDFARSIALGHGPVAQPGGPVMEGYSDPTRLALLIAGRKLRLFGHGYLIGLPEYIVYPKAVATLCCAGILACIHFAARGTRGVPE